MNPPPTPPPTTFAMHPDRLAEVQSSTSPTPVALPAPFSSILSISSTSTAHPTGSNAFTDPVLTSFRDHADPKQRKENNATENSESAAEGDAHGGNGNGNRERRAGDSAAFAGKRQKGQPNSAKGKKGTSNAGTLNGKKATGANTVRLSRKQKATLNKKKPEELRDFYLQLEEEHKKNKSKKKKKNKNKNKLNTGAMTTTTRRAEKGAATSPNAAIHNLKQQPLAGDDTTNQVQSVDTSNDTVPLHKATHMIQEEYEKETFHHRLMSKTQLPQWVAPRNQDEDGVDEEMQEAEHAEKKEEDEGNGVHANMDVYEYMKKKGLKKRYIRWDEVMKGLLEWIDIKGDELDLQKAMAGVKLAGEETEGNEKA